MLQLVKKTTTKKIQTEAHNVKRFVLFFPLCCCNLNLYGCALHSLSVIDESSNTESMHFSAWEAYRQKFGTRARFYVLQPYFTPTAPDGAGNVRTLRSYLKVPSNYNGFAPVTTLRDGITGFALNWYEGLNFANTINRGDKVSLFLDNSGSVNVERDISLSRDLLLEMLANHVAADDGEDYPITEAAGNLLYVSNGAERWILPHLDITCDDAGEITQEEPA